MDRRTLLVALGASPVVLAGCVGGFPLAGRGGHVCVEPDHPDIVCGRADDRVDEHHQVENEDVTYLGDGRVEVVTARGRDGPTASVIREFEDWAPGRCARVAGQAALAHVQDRLDHPEGIGGGHGRLVEEYGDTHAFIQYTRTEDDPPVSFEEVADHTPPQVSVTVELEDHQHDCTIPVYLTSSPP